MKSKSASSKNFSYLHFGLLLIVLPAWMLLNESVTRKEQKIDFISNEERLDSFKLYMNGLISEIDTHHFNSFNHQKAYIENDSTINISITASLIRLTLVISGSNYTADIIQMDCMPPRKNYRIIRQKLELMPFEMKHGKYLKGNYSCTATPFNDWYRNKVLKIDGYFDLELVKY